MIVKMIIKIIRYNIDILDSWYYPRYLVEAKIRFVSIDDILDICENSLENK
jgi:hypothetical protein